MAFASSLLDLLLLGKVAADVVLGSAGFDLAFFS